jgi:G:T/U-mismatch repair DNA glycosylase
MRTHPFPPLIPPSSTKLLVGTLPPEGVRFYFSNSSNTRLWDILKAIYEKSTVVCKGGNALSDREKTNILSNLNLGISDIIYKYERDDLASTNDKHINPKAYNDLLELAAVHNITALLFVYKNAFRWFLHSLDKTTPVKIRKLKRYGLQDEQVIEYRGRSIRCVQLPSPLNRGQKGQTLQFKLEVYRKHIVG